MSDKVFNGKKILTFCCDFAEKCRMEYSNSLHIFAKSKLEEGYSNRDSFMSPDLLLENQEYYRNEYLKTIGFPFELVDDTIPKAVSEFLGEDDFCKTYKLIINVTKDIPFYGLLMIPHGITKAPLVIAQHGGGGTPEFCSDFLWDNNYNFFTKRALEKGCVVFAPSLMLWRYEGLSTGESFPSSNVINRRHEIDAMLQKVGLRITGLEVFCIMRCIDYLTTLDCVRADSIGMMGLSYGGYFSMHTAAADTRIKSIYNGASFNDRTTICFGDWSYYNAANRFHDAEVAGLCAPRKLRIDVGKTDAVFDYKPSVKEAERIEKFYSAFNATDNLQFCLWEGGHKFESENSGFEFFFEALST